jgi:hypothetical protein
VGQREACEIELHVLSSIDQPSFIEVKAAPLAEHCVLRAFCSAVSDDSFASRLAGQDGSLKWDGFRTIAEVGATGVKLYSRNRFEEIVRSLEKLKHEAVLVKSWRWMIRTLPL